MSDSTVHIAVEPGRVSRHLKTPELAIRLIEPDPDPDGEDYANDYGGDRYGGDLPTRHEYRLQGRIVNATRSKLSSVKYDVAYFDDAGRFLGLDKCGFLDDDELDTGEDYLAIDMELTIPADATRCVFNCRALTASFFARFFWG